MSNFKGKALGKRKAEATQEFFDKSKAGTKSGFTFSKAPINKDIAKKEFKEVLDQGRHHTQKAEQRKNNFVTNLYKDEVEVDELRVLGGEDFDSGLDEASEGEIKRREVKRARKVENKAGFTGFDETAALADGNKIAKFKLTKGSVGLFAVSEIHEGKYAIVNHTRNVKGYISLGSADAISLKVGQLVVAAVTAIGTGQHNTETSGNLNRKLQLSLEPSVVNVNLKGEAVTENMLFQALVQSREAKGYMLDLGFKDKAAGFVKFSTENEEMNGFEAGELIQVLTSSSANKNIVKCEMASTAGTAVCRPVNKATDAKVTINTVKPGFLVDAKVAKVFENGVQLSFLSGLEGTVFADHLKPAHEYKVGEKVKARVISVDPNLKRICLSMAQHVLDFTPAPALPAVGQFFENATVTDVVFGSSFTVKLTDTLNAFLHKSHVEIPEEEEKPMTKQETKEQKKKGKKKFKAVKAKDSDCLLNIGQVLEKVRVKELNFFDGMAIISMRKVLIDGSAMDYSQLVVGDFVKTTIKSVGSKQVTLAINDFIDGQMTLDHMGEMPLKSVPPKYKQINKEVRVRIFSVDVLARQVLFTKKDSLMKEKTPMYGGDVNSIEPGSKILGVVVGQIEHGFVVKSFGNIKGLLTLVDIEKNKQIGNFKIGSMVKAWVLFNKKKSGLALTLDKKRAKKSNDKVDVKETFESYLPNAEDAKSLKKTYKTLLSKQDNEQLIGKSFNFKIADEKDNYYVVKSEKDESSKTRVVAVVPKCLAQSCGIAMPLNAADFRCQGLVLEEHVESGLAVVSLQPELDLLKEQMPASAADFKAGLRLFLGFIDTISRTEGATVRFMNGFTRQIGLKDCSSHGYRIGQIVRVALNKLDRPSLKQQVVELADPAQNRRDREVQLEALSTVSNLALNTLEIRVGMKVTATVQLVKDYGLIVAIEKYADLTGFVVNEQKLSPDKQYKEGQKLDCIVLDCDTEKAIVDLSERLSTSKQSEESSKKSAQKAFVEVVKDQYLVVTLKSNRSKVVACILHPFNLERTAAELYQKFAVGEEIDISLLPSDNKGFLLAMPKSIDSRAIGDANKNTSLEEGQKVVGTLRSIKSNCLYVHVGQAGRMPLIGRLHRVECNKPAEFDQYKPGDKVEAKVLKLSKDGTKTWIELTRRQAHLESNSLDQNTLRLLQTETMPHGQPIQALVTEVHSVKSSCPVSIQVSPFVHAQLQFSDCMAAKNLKQQEDLTKWLNMKYKVGVTISVVYFPDGRFVEHGIATVSKQLENKGFQEYKKGDRVMVRFVKSVKSFGITVQLNAKTFGNIELCEITDKLEPNMLTEIKERGIFLARVIDTDKKGRLQLSARQSITDEAEYAKAGFEGTDSHKFQQADAARQEQGNMRNAVIKFGAEASIKQGALVTGYVTGLSKAGCFVQIGHQVSGRAALTELSDEAQYDFSKRMAKGMLVVGRVTKKSEGPRFDLSLRDSLVVHGVGQIMRGSLEVGQEHTVVVLAIAADAVCFAQIKGSYHKLKVKNAPTKQLAIGEQCQVKLLTVQKDKLVSEFVTMTDKADEAEKVREDMLKNLCKQVHMTQEADMDFLNEPDMQEENTKMAEIFNSHKKKDIDYAQQIADLEELNKIDDEEMEEAGEEDSDFEHMQKLITNSKVIEEKDDEEEISESGEEGEQEMEESDSQSDVEMIAKGNDSDSDSEDSKEKQAKVKSGKKALRAQIQIEKQIREKEAAMREEDVGGKQNLSIDDYERLLMADKDQSYLWMQYLAFVLGHLDVEAARRVAQRAVKSVSMTNEADKLNLWIAFMNMESQFGTQETLEECVKGALEVNDRQKVYLQLIQIYRASGKLDFVEEIFKKLCKKYHTVVNIWSSYIEFLFEMAESDDAENFTPAKTILQRSLQALPRASHITIISKFGTLEFKNGRPEAGRTMLEGIVANFPKRMDIWAIYMDMEVKYGAAGKGGNPVQSRHLFERCLSLKEIQIKPKKMKLVFRKYMEFEDSLGNKKQLADLRQRVEQYLEKTFKEEEKSEKSEAEKKSSSSGSSSSSSDDGESGEDEESGEQESEEMTD